MVDRVVSERADHVADHMADRRDALMAVAWSVTKAPAEGFQKNQGRSMKKSVAVGSIGVPCDKRFDDIDDLLLLMPGQFADRFENPPCFTGRAWAAFL